jgi:hypothetical protein
MAAPIYKVFIGKPSAAWYRLSLDEQRRIIQQVDAALAAAGGKRLVLGDASWSSDQWQVAGVEEFPSIEAVQQFTAALRELNWPQYHDSISVLATDLVMT